MIRRSFGFLAVVSALTFSPLAQADVIPPAGDCEGKSEGTACKDFDGKPGACGTITYTRSFTPPFPDAAAETSERSYFGCKTGAAPKSGATSNSNGSSSGKGCSVGNVGAAGPTNDAWLGLGLGFACALVLARRKRER